MKLEELEARKIIKMVLGDKREPRAEDQLAILFKKRFTKKEREVLNAKASEVDKQETLSALKIDEARYDALLAGAIKKLKNESVHGDFFSKVSRINQDT